MCRSESVSLVHVAESILDVGARMSGEEGCSLELQATGYRSEKRQRLRKRRYLPSSHTELTMGRAPGYGLTRQLLKLTMDPLAAS